ncbi:aminotransferase class I/II-fold pyridoxal phosphate-dependent enzyme [Dehalobacterium formicoaceticum]|uniref:Aminotransferase n=1 Tax=Dehalobacterium formicoaceticum TaxID=51515 RepID=A0ABT1Y631_9FIRM|nr:aminotransferase class I/II-fold pyridoxal phosphate-dependent enzyme [Dehalobacterium formicoaceticum]MCR6546345.1 aminotransferase class I/II-fold pyridoxal phosphate-dependent enzyme [Dehalobacterium formicoaceticum]
MSFNPQDFITPGVRDLPPSGIRKFFDLVTEMKDVISLGVGEPDFVSPWHVREACVYSLEKGYTMYTSNYGLPELRYEIAQYLDQRFGVAYDEKKEIIVTVGASEAVDIALRTICSPGDEVLIPEPCYVSYKPCVALTGAIPIVIPTTVENEFKLTPQMLETYITPKTKAIILSYPNNPTGAVMTGEELAALCKVIVKHNLIVVSDEIYAELTYDGVHTCIASLPEMRDRTILINGMSKAFAMTGWRIGYLCAHEDFIENMVKIHQYTMLCAPIMGQKAAIEAFRSCRKEVDRMREEYDQRRRIIYKRMQDMGLEVFEPKGAFYIFPSIQNTGLSSEEFAGALLKEEKVAVVPGSAFADCGEGFLRCSYASSIKKITLAMDRMERFVSKRITTSLQDCHN